MSLSRRNLGPCSEQPLAGGLAHLLLSNAATATAPREQQGSPIFRDYSVTTWCSRVRR